MVAKTKADKRAQEIAELASSRRVTARRLPMDLTLAGGLATCLILEPRVPGLWVLFGLAALWTVGGVYALVTTSRKLASTLPEERGKRSDDKALARAQNTLGCLGPLLIGTIGVVVVFYAHRGTWPWQPWVVAVGGIVGQVSGIAAIEWARRVHRSATGPAPAGDLSDQP